MRLAAVVTGGGRAVLALPIGYLSLLTVAAWVASARRRRPPPTTQVRFAILVPAHDEEAVIGAALAGFAALAYPTDRFTVHVVADHCTDGTVALARDAGVDVREKESGVAARGRRCSGRSVSSSTRRPPATGRSTRSSSSTPTRSSPRASSPQRPLGSTPARRAVQGQYRVREPGQSTATALRAAASSVRHHLRPFGRTTLGGSCGLFGNGMVFTADLLRSREWTNHLTEDIELQNELLLDGVRVAYEPDAVVEALMPTSLDASRTQNERWERGRIELARRFVPPLLRLARRDRSRRVAAIDAVADHLVPPLSVLAAATVATAVGGTAVALLRGSRRPLRGWGLVGALAVHVASGLVLAKAPAAVYRSLLHAPAMVLWKVRLWGRMLTRPGAEGWTRTARATEER